ncbi:MAG: electron transfer flavoprotein subunit beta/FixA family protein [Bacteroidia bacterium]|nr:electron transfer flavoprotein subunit beta/FixA family protein [Bacteroidia bacterium]
MKILVCISNVPDTTTKINFNDDNKSLKTDGVQFIINPWDEMALSRAIEIATEKSGTVTVINVGEATTEPTIRKALAIGANDAIRVNSHPHDAFFVATEIANAVKDGGYDLILTGRESIDFNGSQVDGMLAELLGLPSVSACKSLKLMDDNNAELDREIEGGKQTLTCPLPMVVSATEGMAEPKIPNMRGIMSARTKPLTVVEPSGASAQTEVLKFDKPPVRSEVKLVDENDMDELVNLLHTEAKVI